MKPQGIGLVSLSEVLGFCLVVIGLILYITSIPIKFVEVETEEGGISEHTHKLSIAEPDGVKMVWGWVSLLLVAFGLIVFTIGHIGRKLGYMMEIIERKVEKRIGDQWGQMYRRR